MDIQGLRAMIATERKRWRDIAAGADATSTRGNEWVALRLVDGGRLDAIQFTAEAMTATGRDLSLAIRHVHAAALRDLLEVAAAALPSVTLPAPPEEPTPGGEPVGGVDTTIQVGQPIAVPSPMPHMPALDPHNVDEQVRAQVQQVIADAQRHSMPVARTAHSDVVEITVNAIGHITDVVLQPSFAKLTAAELADDIIAVRNQALAMS